MRRAMLTRIRTMKRMNTLTTVAGNEILHRSVQCVILNNMVQQDVLDRTFAALSDSTRRGILERLGDGPATIGQLAEPTGMTLTGMKKHVQVLEDAGLVVSEKV